MAIVLDDNVQSAPRINERIGGGRARITMGRSGGRPLEQWLADAQTLSLALKAGALPAPVTTGEIRQVGASLGDELIRKGSLASIVGLALVILFMALYYRAAGLIADLALALNGLLMLAGLALFNATLTLPGLAAFALTLGIAVDANVLINERIREELRPLARRRARRWTRATTGPSGPSSTPTSPRSSRLHPLLHGDGPGARLRHHAHHRPAGVALHVDLVTRVFMNYFVHGRKTLSV
jgi:preprotein translocase subunit SecD